MEEILKQINAIAKIAKERELTSEEIEKRDELRKEYIKIFKAGILDTLDNTYIQDANGDKHKLKRKEGFNEHKQEQAEEDKD